MRRGPETFDGGRSGDFALSSELAVLVVAKGPKLTLPRLRVRVRVHTSFQLVEERRGPCDDG